MEPKVLIGWNVNGIRAGVRKGFVDIFNEIDADIFCLQETKAQDDQVVEALKEIHGYHMVVNSAVKKGYSGTAILSKEEPISTSIDIGIEEHDQEGRVTRMEFEEFNLVNVYVPNSGSGQKRLEYRAKWDAAFKDYLVKLKSEKPLVVTGDFNVANAPIDLARPKENYNKTSGYTQVEIDGFENFKSEGLIDTYRALNPERVQYTFWNQRFRARERNVGWRIDYWMVSEDIMDAVANAAILEDIRGSDHCPIELVLEI